MRTAVDSSSENSSTKSHKVSLVYKVDWPNGYAGMKERARVP